jgi:hypothetical protein
MKEVRIEYSIGPVEQELEVAGSFHYKTNNISNSFIVSALKKSIAKLKITNQSVIVGLLDVYVDGVRSYEVGILGTSKLIKTEIRKL